MASVTIPNGVTNIGDSTFEDCSGLISVTIPNGVTNIGDSTFEGCSGLTSVTIPNSVKSIGRCAFLGCSKLVEVINKSSLNIEKGTMAYGEVALYALNVKSEGPSEVSTINDYVFYTNEGINYLIAYKGNDTALELPDNYNGESYVINEYAFSNCENLISVEIPNSVTSIGASAFRGCTGLTSIIIPTSVTSIERSTFISCSKLNSYYLGNRDEWYEIRNYYCLDSVTSFYSSTQPTDTEYNYWHYYENGNPVTW